MKKRLAALILVAFLLAGFAVSSFSSFNSKLLAADVAAEESFIPVIQGWAAGSSRSDRPSFSDPDITSNEPTTLIRRTPDITKPTVCTISSLEWSVDQAFPDQEVFVTAQGTGDCGQQIIYLSFHKGSQFLEELPAQFDKTTAQIAWTVPSDTSMTSPLTKFFRTFFRTKLPSTDPITYITTTSSRAGTIDITDDYLITSPPLSIDESSLIGGSGGEPGSGPDIPCS